MLRTLPNVPSLSESLRGTKQSILHCVTSNDFESVASALAEFETPDSL